MKDLQPKTMTVKEVADALNVSTDLIKKRIREIFPDKMENGKTTYLNEYEVTSISSRIKENSSLVTYDDRNRLPTTQAEEALMIVKGYELAIQRYTELQKQIDILKPKAELADMALRDESEHYSITQAGKHMDLSQGQMFAILREYKLLTKENLPTQKAISLRLLQLRTNANCNGRNRQQAIMTMENIFNFKERYL